MSLGILWLVQFDFNLMSWALFLEAAVPICAFFPLPYSSRVTAVFVKDRQPDL